jgi:hypothetical protein
MLVIGSSLGKLNSLCTNSSLNHKLGGGKDHSLFSCFCVYLVKYKYSDMFIVYIILHQNLFYY